MTDSIKVKNPGYEEKLCTIKVGVTEYDFPTDFGELVLLSVANPYSIEGKKIVLVEEPKERVANGIRICYLPNKEGK